MRARVTVVIIVLMALSGVGLLLTRIVAQRQEAARLQCLNNLRMHGQAAADIFDLAGKMPKEIRDADIPGAVPAGTVFVPGRAPEDRLSWIADTLGGMSQRPQPLTELAARLDRSAAWDAGPNAEIGRTPLKLFTCPANVPDGVVSQYVGVAGLGTDAATIPIISFPFGLGRPWLIPRSPRAGSFRYDSPTPFDVIHRNDGLDNTLLFAEVSIELGPWMRGGPSTVRGVDDGPNARPPVGFAGQFGGNHPHGVAAVAWCSGAARFVTPRIDPTVFRAMATIAGGESDGIPGE